MMWEGYQRNEVKTLFNPVTLEKVFSQIVLYGKKELLGGGKGTHYLAKILTVFIFTK